MTTIDTTAQAPGTATDAGEALAGVAAWITTSDHKRIGRCSSASASSRHRCGRARPAPRHRAHRCRQPAIAQRGSVDQLFVAFRVLLAYGVVVPMLLGVAIALVPLQLGARSLSFPRLAQLGFWTWLFGLGALVYSLANDGGPGGRNADMVDLFLVAHWG
jgi:heme/copper-type cytochrome/quinol oxidase subunit 1